MSDLIGYGEFIKHHRIASGYRSQRQLADVTGISSATLSRIESEIQKPQMDTVRVLSKFLKTTTLAELMDSVGYLEGLDDQKKNGINDFFEKHNALDTDIENAVIKIMTIGVRAIHQMAQTLEHQFQEEINDYKEESGRGGINYSLMGVLEFLRFTDPSIEAKTELKTKLESIVEKYADDTPESPWKNNTIEMVEIPIYGEIRAGYNFLVQENIVGYETVSKESVRDGSYYYLIVNGDSMIEEGIREGMRVLVKSQNHCDHGKIGVVIVNGDEATLKRVFYEKDTVILQAANRNIPPRILPIQEVRFQGQVKKVEFDV